MLQLERAMLNRLTVPQLKKIAAQLRIDSDHYQWEVAEKEWIVGEIVAHQTEQSISPTLDFQAIHDSLLRVEGRLADSQLDPVRNARQQLKTLL